MDVRGYIDQHAPEFLGALKQWLAIPSISADPGRPVDSPAVLAARRALQRAFGPEVLFTREGGSGPEADLADILAAPLVFVGVGLDEDCIHAPNEKVDMELLLKGAEAVAYRWDELAAAAGELVAAQ